MQTAMLESVACRDTFSVRWTLWHANRSSGIERRIVRIACRAFRIERRRVRLIKRCVQFEAARQIRIRSEELAPRDRVGLTGVKQLLRGFLRELLVRNIRAAECFFKLRSDAVVAERFAGCDKRDLAFAEFACDIAKGRSRV